MPDAAALLAVVLGLCGVVAHVSRLTWPLALPLPARILLTAALAGALAAQLLLSAAPAGRSLGGQMKTACGRLWPAFVPLAALLGGADPAWMYGACWALLAWLLQRGGAPASPPARADATALLVVGLVGCVLFLVIGARTRDHHDNDPRYYFGVARHIARTWRFEEPIVWQFLSPPATLVHRPFDYWQGLTSLVLVPPLVLFGNTHRVAFVTMAALSSVSVILFWYLITCAAPLRSRLARLVALFLFTFAPGMAHFRFDTESVVLFHVVLLAAFCAYGRRWYTLAVVAACFLPLSRGDGWVGCGLIWAAATWRAARERRGAGAARRFAPALAAAAFAAAYVGYHLAMFGSPTPPGARLAPMLADYGQLFAFRPKFQPAREVIERLFDHGYFTDRFNAMLNALREPRFVDWAELWFGLGMLTGVGAGRPGRSVPALAATLLFLGSFLISWTNPHVFASWRTLYTMLPAAILLAGAALDIVLTRVQCWIARVRFAPLRGLASGAVSLALVGFVLGSTPVYGEPPPLDGELARKLRRLSPVLGGKPVAAVNPWSVVADTASPVVMIPHDGEASVEAALRKYRVQWIVIDADPADLGESADLLRSLRDGTRTTLGRLRVEKVEGPNDLPIFRVIGAS